MLAQKSSCSSCSAGFQARKCKRRRRKAATCPKRKKRRTTATTKKRRKRKGGCKPGSAQFIGLTYDGRRIYQTARGTQFYCMNGKRVQVRNCARSQWGPCMTNFNRPRLCRTSRSNGVKWCVPRTRDVMRNPMLAQMAYNRARAQALSNYISASKYGF